MDEKNQITKKLIIN
ncbi:MAG: hypothetical protein ACJZ0Y_05455 [Cytophagales bacterium]